MNIIPMMNEIPSIANPMIRESALPDFRIAPYESAELMRIRTLDELHAALKGYVGGGREQKMDVIGHEDEGVQEITTFTSVMEHNFEK